VQAVTRVNCEQASKVKSRVPTVLRNREGRCVAEEQPTDASATTAGVVQTACMQGMVCNAGDARSSTGGAVQRRRGRRLSGRSDRPIVAQKPGNAGGAKGPDFGVLVKALQGEGLA